MATDDAIVSLLSSDEEDDDVVEVGEALLTRARSSARVDVAVLEPAVCGPVRRVHASSPSFSPRPAADARDDFLYERFRAVRERGLRGGDPFDPPLRRQWSPRLEVQDRCVREGRSRRPRAGKFVGREVRTIAGRLATVNRPGSGVGQPATELIDVDAALGPGEGDADYREDDDVASGNRKRATPYVEEQEAPPVRRRSRYSSWPLGVKNASSALARAMRNNHRVVAERVGGAGGVADPRLVHNLRLGAPARFELGEGRQRGVPRAEGREEPWMRYAAVAREGPWRRAGPKRAPPRAMWDPRAPGYEKQGRDGPLHNWERTRAAQVRERVRGDLPPGPVDIGSAPAVLTDVPDPPFRREGRPWGGTMNPAPVPHRPAPVDVSNVRGRKRPRPVVEEYDDEDEDDDEVDPGARALVPRNATSGGGLWKEVSEVHSCNLLCFACPWIESTSVNATVKRLYEEFRNQSLWDCAVALVTSFPPSGEYLPGLPGASGSNTVSVRARVAPLCGLLSQDVVLYIARRVDAYIRKDMLAAEIAAIVEIAEEDGIARACGLCFATYDAKDVVMCEKGAHRYCRECHGSYVVKTNIETRLNYDLSQVPCIDPSCESRFSVFDCEANINSYELFLVREKAEFELQSKLMEMVGGTKFTCVCGVIAVVEGDGPVMCPGCQGSFCLRCKMKSHDGPCPIRGKLTKLFRTGGNEYGRCPTCGEGIARTGGCNHINCVTCGKAFCVVCSKGYERGVYSHPECETAASGFPHDLAMQLQHRRLRNAHEHHSMLTYPRNHARSVQQNNYERRRILRWNP